MLLKCLALAIMILTGVLAMRGLPRTVRSVMKMSSVRTMEVAEFGKIVRDDDVRKQYQVIDVREKDELAASSLKYGDVINLPMSAAEDWSRKVAAGDLLDKSKPTLCICKLGGRSMKMATFLASQAGFEEVYSVNGGMNKYVTEVDPSAGKAY